MVPLQLFFIHCCTFDVITPSIGIPLFLWYCINDIPLDPMLLSFLPFLLNWFLHAASMIFHWFCYCYHFFHCCSIGPFMLHQWYCIGSFTVIIPTIAIPLIPSCCTNTNGIAFVPFSSHAMNLDWRKSNARKFK